MEWWTGETENVEAGMAEIDGRQKSAGGRSEIGGGGA